MRRLALAGVVGGVVVLLVVAQLVLPGIAAQRVRDNLARSGQVLSVQVQAFPAIELLWHHANRTITVFSNPHVAVQSVRASPVAGGFLGPRDRAGSLTP